METRTRWAYGSGATAIGIVDSVPGLLLLYFMTERLSLDPAVSGGLIFVVRCAGLIIDPLVGRAWDQRPSLWHRRWAALAAAYATLALSYGALFILPQSLSPSGQYAAIAAGLGGITAATSVIAVLHVGMATGAALPAALRESLVAARSGGFFAGLLIGGSVAPTIVETQVFDVGGWTVNALAMFTLILTTALPTLAASRNWPTASQPTIANSSVHPRVFIRLPLAALTATNLLQVLGLAVAFGSLPYLLASSNAAVPLGLFVAITVSAAAISVIGWQKAATRIGLATSFGIAGVTFAAAFALAAASSDFVVAEIVAAALCGIGLGGIQFASYALLVETLDQIANDRPSAGLIGIWTSLERASLALGPLVVGLGLSGFGKTGEMTSLSAALTAIFMITSLLLLRLFVGAHRLDASQGIVQ